MSETGEPRRRRRQAAGSMPGEAGAQPVSSAQQDIPHTQPGAAQETGIPVIPAQAQEGAAARRRRAQRLDAGSTDTPRQSVRHEASSAGTARQSVRQETGSADTARRRTAAADTDRAKPHAPKASGAKKALKTAKETAIGVGGLLLLLWEENAKPALRALGRKLRTAADAAAQKLSGMTAKDGAGRSAGTDGGVQRAGTDGVTRRKANAGAQPREELLRRAAMIALACVACYSLFMIGSIVLRTIRTNRLTDELSRMKREAAIHTPEPGEEMGFTVFIPETPTPTPPEETPVPQTTAAPTPTPTPRPQDTVKTTIYHEVGGEALPEMEALYNQNRDLVAWIGIEEVLDLPVMYRDNSYYLTRDFYKKKNTAGTLFLDVNHPFKERTQNLLLHGHNMKDGTMFGRLAQYEQDISYLKNHAFIDFDTLWKHERYVIFAVLHVSLDVKSDAFFNYYSYPTFSSDAAFESYVTQLQLRSMYAIPVDVEPGDALLTLSTCLDEDRLVIVARKLRENETKSSLRSAVRLATRQ